MRIRSATKGDIPAMMLLEQHAATAAHWSAEQYQTACSSKAPSRAVLITEDETGVQGFIIGRALDEEWEIENLAIAGPARRKGLGTRLLGEFLDWARSRGALSVFLEVRESNLAARRLYEKLGFLEGSRRKRYYCEPDEDAIVFQLKFP